ncbi:hypothetical protein E2C01_075812 [Portunus trituberculatus]|uniref:Uncharacterized protein n=1 Tax=Portunus trituberculatus TaxID=210409 RepID=A0A5B7IG03_PORTR|nr:hypothetical protein [Portunus trituberculatus]
MALEFPAPPTAHPKPYFPDGHNAAPTSRSHLPPPLKSSVFSHASYLHHGNHFQRSQMQDHILTRGSQHPLPRPRISQTCGQSSSAPHRTK